MNCQELTTAISNIKAQISELDSAVGARDPKEAINIKNDIIKQFNGELKEYADTFYRNSTPENYDKEVNRILNKIGDKDPSEVTFSRKELIFIYDTDDKAKFGNSNQESIFRIKKIRNQRTYKQREDASIIFNLPPDQIAWAREHINQNTKAYIGPLFRDIFKLPNFEHIYTFFPEVRIRRGEYVTCGKNGSELLTDLEARGINLVDGAKTMLQSRDFIVHDANETVHTIRLRVSDLFSDDETHTYEEIIDRARVFGLIDNLPHETAANMLLNKSTQPNLGESYFVASKIIADYHGLFSLRHADNELHLNGNWTFLSDEWNPGYAILFGLRKSS